jgi:CHAT domain-containing protein
MARDPRHDAAEALRQAQLALIAQAPTAHPFDWAAFTLIGDGA